MSEEVEQLLAELDRAHNFLQWIRSISDHQLILHQRLEQLAFRNYTSISHQLRTKGYDVADRTPGSTQYVQHSVAEGLLTQYNAKLGELGARMDKTTNRAYSDIDAENTYLKARVAQLETMLKEQAANVSN